MWGGVDQHNVLLAVDFNSDLGDRIREMLSKRKSRVIVYEAEEKLSPGELVRERQEGSIQKVTTRAQKKEIEREHKATNKPCIKGLNHPVAPKEMNIQLKELAYLMWMRT